MPGLNTKILSQLEIYTSIYYIICIDGIEASKIGNLELNYGNGKLGGLIMAFKYYSFSDAISQNLDANGYGGDEKDRLYSRIFRNIKMIEDMEYYNVIVYGSLLNPRSRSRTVRNDREVKPVTVPGIRRIFNVDFHSKYSVLNVQESNIDMNALSIQLSYPEMIDFVIREMHYELQLVNSYDYGSTNIFDTEDAYIVMAAKESIGNSLPLVNYLHAVIYGAYQYGENFLNDFLNSTFYMDGDVVRNISSYVTHEQIENFKLVDSTY